MQMNSHNCPSVGSKNPLNLSGSNKTSVSIDIGKHRASASVDDCEGVHGRTKSRNHHIAARNVASNKGRM